MRVVGTNVMDAFCARHPDCRKWFAVWLSEVKKSSWKDSHQIRARFASASFLADNVVFFNVRGNEYRMEVQIAYNVGVIAVKWIGKHADYTKRLK